jgi:hypothetical protein
MLWVYVFRNARKRGRRLVLCRHPPPIKKGRHCRDFLMHEIYRNLEDEKIGQG